MATRVIDGWYTPAREIVLTHANPAMKIAMALAAIALLVSGGCDRSQPASPASPATPATPATAPAAAPATTTASTRPANSLLNIDGRTVVFPAARLRLESDGQHLVALLFSDDPKDALKDNYTGNSFYLRMELDVADADKLADAHWHYTAPSSGDREDSPYGVYLGGKKLQLQPLDVYGKFKLDEEGTAVLISGQFQVVDDSAGRGPPQLVVVAANLPVRVQATK